MLNNKNYAIMKNDKPIKPIYRVEYRNNETGVTEAKSVFFENIEDAREYNEGMLHLNCTGYICKYWLK